MLSKTMGIALALRGIASLSIDPLRIGIVGYSLGSYIALQTAPAEKSQSGHVLPPAAADDAAAWIVEQLP
ncbi:MAG: hypothetical protein ABIZ36_02920 [Gemmatimonadaceae bacterium]